MTSPCNDYKLQQIRDISTSRQRGHTLVGSCRHWCVVLLFFLTFIDATRIYEPSCPRHDVSTRTRQNNV